MSIEHWEPLEHEDGREHVAILFSGGFDSATLVLHMLSKGYRVTCFFIDYHQAQYYMERQKVMKFIDSLKSENKPIELVYLTTHLDKEEGDYYPFRNLSLISFVLNQIASGYPDIHSLYYGAIGGCGEDAFYDCSPEFIALVNILAGREGGITVDAPFIYMDKEEVALLANELGLHPADTWSCNFPTELGQPCGKCKDCLALQEMYPHLYLDKK